MSLGRFILRRALFALLFAAVVSSAALLLTLATPGDFVSGDDHIQDPARIAVRRAQLGLDRPLLTQYADWVQRVVRFDFGMSLAFTRPVSGLVAERSLNTAVLATSALMLATLVGIPLGVYTGARQRGMAVFVIRMCSSLLISLPPLLAALLLVMLAARTRWVPLGGMASAGAADLEWAAWLGDLMRHLVVPTLALAFPLAATLERLQSEAMRTAVAEPFVHAARARGLSLDAVTLRHAWRVSLGSILGLYGVIIGTLFSGSFVVEFVTAWPGLGRLMYDALLARDLYLVAGCAAAGAVFLAAGTFLADLLQAAADPRVRLELRS